MRNGKRAKMLIRDKQTTTPKAADLLTMVFPDASEPDGDSTAAKPSAASTATTSGAAQPAPNGQLADRRAVVVLTTYNEAGCIESAVRRVGASAVELARDGAEVHLLLADDESPDGTADIARQVAAEIGLPLAVSSAPRAGLGRAYLRAMALIVDEGWANLVVTLDADGQHDPAMIPTLVREHHRRNLDLIIGSRWVPGARVDGLTPMRRLLSRGGNLLFSVATGTSGVRDATTSFRVFSTDLAAAFDEGTLLLSGYSFLSSYVGVAHASGYKIGEHPISFAVREAGESKLSSREVVQFAKNLPRLRATTRAIRRERKRG